MADRAHTIAIAARKKFLADQAKERSRLTDELAEAEKSYHEWCEPKRRVEKLRNDQRTFETQNRVCLAEIEAQVSAAADPQIFAAIRALDGERERISMAFAAVNSKERKPGPSNSKNLDARTLQLKLVGDELAALVNVEVADVPAAIREILSKLPAVLEYA